MLRLGGPAAALHFLPQQHGRNEAAGGLLAVGDDAGSLLLLSTDGQLVAQHHTGGRRMPSHHVLLVHVGQRLLRLKMTSRLSMQRPGLKSPA